MRIRLATKNDLGTIIELTRELAIYEKEGEIFHAEEQFFLDNFFCEKPTVECYLIEDESSVVGMGEVFLTLSTYTSTYKLNLQDFYIRQAHRSKGYGKAFMMFLAQEAKKRNCSRICWTVYKWNDLAIDLYDKVGSSHDDVAVYSMGADEIESLLDS